MSYPVDAADSIHEQHHESNHSPSSNAEI